MIYFVSNILGNSEWAWRAREWALALEPLDMRVFSTDRAILQRELFPKEHRGVLDIATRPPKPTHCALRFGPVPSFMNLAAGDRAPFEVAIVDWWTDRLPPRVARVLKERFDQVWVPTESQVATLLKSGVGAYLIPDPVDLKAWKDASPLEEHPGETLLYAIGSWGFPDHLEIAARAFHDAFELEDPVRLLLVCPDCPIQTAEDLHVWARSPKVGRSSVQHRLPKGPVELRRLHAMGDVYVDTHRCLGPSWQARLAPAAGSQVVDTKHPVPVEGSHGLYTAPQQWAGSPTADLSNALLAAAGGQETALLAPVSRIEVQRRVEVALKGVSTDVKGPEPVPAGPAKPKGDTLCFVVPHRGRGPQAVERCLRQLRAMGGLEPQDRIVVADQAVESELEEVCREYGATLVVDTEPPPSWNPARCRNQGVKAFPSADYYAPVDVDCLVPEFYAIRIREELSYEPWAPLTPSVQFGTEDLTLGEVPWHGEWPLGGKLAPAAGMTVYPRHIWWDASGMDEGFTEWGSEDMDLLWRIRAAGIDSRLIEELVVYHCLHELNPAKEASGKRNLERLNKRMAGEVGAANLEGWGIGGRVVFSSNIEEEKHALPEEARRCPQPEAGN
jgi:hypothetical protein